MMKNTKQRLWSIDIIEEHIVAAGYHSVKEWRIDNWACYLAAQRMGIVPLFAAIYGLDYNPNMKRTAKKTKGSEADGKPLFLSQQ
jgi:hypothetical protein